MKEKRSLLSVAGKRRQWLRPRYASKGSPVSCICFPMSDIYLMNAPLSKSMLLEDSPQLQQVLPANWWQENNVHLHSGVTIKSLGRDTRELVLTNGESWQWDQLFMATGAAARPLPLLDALGERCFTLRHADDAARLREVLQPERSVVIVGAGTIGLELAASATQRGCKVTVIELAATVMGRNAPPPVQRYLYSAISRLVCAFCSIMPLNMWSMVKK